MNVNKAHGCLLLAVGTPVILVGILGFTIELSQRVDPKGILFASFLLLMGGAGIVCGIWLFRRAKFASNSDAASVDPVTAKATIKAWVIVGLAFSVVYTLLAAWGFVDDIFKSSAVHWSVSITGILLWIGTLLAVTGQYSAARVFFLIGGILGLPLSVPMIIGGKRIQLAGQAITRAEELARSGPPQPTDNTSTQKSAFADQLICKYCGVENHTTQWPTDGDSVAFAYEAEPGNFNLKVHCPNCEKDWYVVWDENPGQLETVHAAGAGGFAPNAIVPAPIA